MQRHVEAPPESITLDMRLPPKLEALHADGQHAGAAVDGCRYCEKGEEPSDDKRAELVATVRAWEADTDKVITWTRMADGSLKWGR